MRSKLSRIDIKRTYFIVFLLGCNCMAFGQYTPLKDQLLKITTSSDSLTHKSSVEKLYLQFDKPYYALNDTLWFKAYLFNAAYLTASDKTGILNIDIANDSNKVVKQYRFSVQAGLSWGNINLNDKEFTTGTYTLRAYTNWMRNFGDDAFFYKTFYISSGNENNLLVNQLVSTSVVNGKNNANVKLQFSDINKKPLILTALDLQVMNGSSRLYKQKIQTGVDGSLNINFNVPQKNQEIAIVAETTTLKDKKALIPIILKRPENADLQFLPEGGSLVAGLPAHVGFKAIREDGKGIDVSGIITDQDQKQVAVFKSLHNGMGSFDLITKEGESYTAKVTLPGGLIKEHPLPLVKDTGTILQVKNTMESDSVEVTVGATNDIVQTGESYFLIGKARGIVCYAAIVNFHEGRLVKRKIAKSLFPSGITHFTLMTEKYQPLNERLVFIEHQDNLNIKLSADKLAYGSRDGVALQIKVIDNQGKPIMGNFSLAVIDDAQIKTDSVNSENIVTRLLLASDLKGHIEEPGYYLSSKTNETWQALDDLLLTQGWIGYNWQQVFNPPAITYQPEHEFEVKGNVLNAFNKPLKGTDVVLFSKSPSLLMDTITDNNGRFIFHQFPKVDTPIFVLKAVNKNGKSFNVGITINEVKPPDFIKPTAPLIMAWYINSDTTLLNYTKSNTVAKQQQYFPNNGHILKEVKITAKKIIKGSQNIYGPPDIVIDEKDLEKAGKKTFLQLLEENVKGFHESIQVLFTHDGSPARTKRWYFIGDRSVFVLIDGVFLHSVYQPFTFDDYKSYLESHNAEDIRGIEVIKGSVFTFIEITSRSGHGPIIDNTPGMYLYRPLPISYPKQFYKPKYTVNDTTKHIPDLRSTIDWEPNITTDANGEAKVSFYTADKPSTYTLIIEGSDMNGNLGYKQGKIIIAKPKAK